MAFSKKDLKNLKKNLNVYGKKSKQIVCDACGKRSVISSAMIKKFKEDNKGKTQIYCPKCGKVIRTTDFF